jgi:hypothetical protein
MGTALDGLNAPSSLSQRRQQQFHVELPPPPLAFNANTVPSQNKYPSISGLSGSQSIHPPVSVGQLLTPPSNSASESGAVSSGIPSSTGAPGPVLPYTPTLFGTGTTPNAYHTGWTPSWQNGPLMSSRSMFSPGAGTSLRPSTGTPTSGEVSTLPPPPYDLNTVQHYGAPLQLSPPQSATHAPTHHSIISPLNVVRPPSQPSPMTPNDLSRPASNPTLYTNIPTTQSQSGYPYSAPTPVSQSPHPQSLSGNRISPTLHQGSQSQPGFMRPPPPSYSLPAMPGPIMSNMHSPGTQMQIMGNMSHGMLPMAFNSGYAANPQAMYHQQRTNTPQQAATHDRPFKCDQCPQSFNRNHDLKRHKRIHLAVKPFPCLHCDKSFSRKDALKVSSSVQ